MRTKRLWIGGSVCSGKTTVVDRLATEPSVAYHFDALERDHLHRLGIEHTIYEDLAEHEARAKLDERWLHPTPEEMAERTYGVWAARFPLVLEDLSRKAAPVIAEGVGLFPELVQTELSSAREAVWLVATPEFIQATRLKRGMSAPALTSDPPRAASNIIARDTIIARKVEASAAALGLRVIAIDGNRSIAEISDEIGEHFGLNGG